MFNEYHKIETRDVNWESFIQITAKNFSIFQDDNEITDPELKKKLVVIKLKSLIYSKNVKEIQKQLQTNFSLLLEGHARSVRTVAVTSDNKYLISGSNDKTIRIWNLLKKTQESVLQGHTHWINSD